MPAFRYLIHSSSHVQPWHSHSLQLLNCYAIHISLLSILSYVHPVLFFDTLLCSL